MTVSISNPGKKASPSRFIQLLVFVVGFTFSVFWTLAAHGANFTRQQLYSALDDYLAALNQGDYEQVNWAKKVLNTENNVELPLGEGLWGTIESLGEYQLRFADTDTGQVGYFGTVNEPREMSALTVRLKINKQARVEEVETLVVRQSDSGIKFENPRYWDKPVLNEFVPIPKQSTRKRLTELANGYFETLEMNDGAIHTNFHPDCTRVENGVQTTRNPEFGKIVPVAALGCEEQFKMGNYRYDDRLRGRRFPLVDVERGLVLAGGFIDHSGRLDKYKLTDGREVSSPVRRPHSFYLMELFKIEDDQLRQIEANFITVPYCMPSPWNNAACK